MTSLKYAHLQVMGTITGKFHQNPLKTVGGDAETKLYLRTDGLTDGRTHYYSPIRQTSDTWYGQSTLAQNSYALQNKYHAFKTLYIILFSCTPDKDIRMFYLGRQFLSHSCYLTQHRIKITCIFNAFVAYGSHVSTSSSDDGVYSRSRQK